MESSLVVESRALTLVSTLGIHPHLIYPPPRTFSAVAMAVTLERSFYCTGDACYLLDDTQPPSEPEPVSSNPLQSDLSLPPSSSLSSPSPPVPHTSSVLPLAQGPVSVLLPLPTSEESTASPSSPSFDLESYLYGACGVRWRIDEFDWVSGSRTVRATKLDEPGSLGACPGTLRGSVPSVGPDGDEPRETGDRVFQAVTRAASPKKRGTNALNLKLPRYSSVIVKHSPLMFNEVLGMQLDPYRQVCPPPSLVKLSFSILQWLDSACLAAFLPVLSDQTPMLRFSIWCFVRYPRWWMIDLPHLIFDSKSSVYVFKLYRLRSFRISRRLRRRC